MRASYRVGWMAGNRVRDALRTRTSARSVFMIGSTAIGWRILHALKLAPQEGDDALVSQQAGARRSRCVR
jgi:hypothetical protein